MKSTDDASIDDEQVLIRVRAMFRVTTSVIAKTIARVTVQTRVKVGFMGRGVFEPA